MSLTSQQSVAIAVLIYFSPALPLGIFVCYRLGIGKVWGWGFLAFFCTIRVVGAALRIAADEISPRREDEGRSGLDVAARSLATMGLVPLLIVMQELLVRIKEGLCTDKARPQQRTRFSLNSSHWFMRTAWGYIPTAQTTAFILGVVAISINSSGLNKAVFVVIAVLFVFQTYIASVYFLERHDYEKSDRNTPTLIMTSVPWLTIRIVFGVGDAFYRGDWLGVVGSALMVYLMEVAVVTVYLLAALKVEPARKSEETESSISSTQSR